MKGHTAFGLVLFIVLGFVIALVIWMPRDVASWTGKAPWQAVVASALFGAWLLPAILWAYIDQHKREPKGDSWKDDQWESDREKAATKLDREFPGSRV